MNQFYALVILAVKLQIFNAQQCLMPADTIGRTIPFSFDNGEASTCLPIGTQAIVTSYKFTCCGRIISWQTYIQPDPNEIQRKHYYVDFQVWRPSPMEYRGCYTLVGYSRFSGFLGNNGLVRKVLKPSDKLEFHLGDVIGLLVYELGHEKTYPPMRWKNQVGIRMDRSYGDEKVWYHINTFKSPLIVGESSCPLPIGPGGRLESFLSSAPLFAVQVASYQGCAGGKALSDKTIHPSLSSFLPPLHFPLQDKNNSSSRQHHFLKKRSFDNNSGWTSAKIAGLVIVLTASFLTFLFMAMSFAAVGLRYCRQCSCLKCFSNGERSRIVENFEEGIDSWTNETNKS